ncbi:MAG TPA: hypothetical protein VHB46_05615 [Burkholderiales bacterium]|nr:hypothetical protein [Burkholderiales bacterium]
MLKATVPIGPNIFLQSDGKGRIYLLINDVLCEATDVVSPQLVPEFKGQKKRDARTVAMKFIIHEYGPNQAHWPELARLFIGAIPAEPADLKSNPSRNADSTDA